MYIVKKKKNNELIITNSTLKIFLEIMFQTLFWNERKKKIMKIKFFSKINPFIQKLKAFLYGFINH